VSAVPTIRRASAADADAILALSVECDVAERGEVETTIEEIRSDLATEGFVGGVIGPDGGELAGFVWAERQPGHQTIYADYSLRPAADTAFAPPMLDWLRDQARALGPGIAPHVFADSENGPKCELYEAAGGTVIRRFYRMGITVDGAATAGPPALDDGILIRGLTDGESDLRAMHRVVNSAFADHYNHEPYSYDKWLEGTVGGRMSDLSLWWLATVDGEPAAGLCAVEFPTAGHVDTLGTLRSYRGKGLARALLLTAFAEFERRGLPRVTLGVDATNPTGALALYESVGMTVEHEGRRYELPAL
jgi:mycothiol synthase